MSAPDNSLNLLLTSRVEFFRRYHSERTIRLFLENERDLTRLSAARQADNILRNVSISLTPMSAAFFDPVTVAPTQQQMDAAFTVPDPRPEGSCPICVENFDDTDPIIRLRNCNHCFHRTCARSWYRMSVHCPVCRNDIRT